ncbi:MAG TPA: sulfotransferase [Conexibacter sp.]|jgi:hypothetical protein|nr:sulfotransferase [Conexibacter sp.]
MTTTDIDRRLTASLPEVTSVAGTGWPWDQILDASLDLPTVGALDDALCLEVAGWVVGSSRPVQAVNVVVDPFPPDGLRVLTVPVSVVREDVLARFPHLPAGQPCGFRTVLSLAGLPASFSVRIEAVFEDGVVERCLEIQGRHPLLDLGYRPSLDPLMVTSLGRTGTTWLMRLLGEHPQIAVHRAYPYEARACSYWMHAFDVLADPHHRDLANKDEFHVHRAAVGHHPLHETGWDDPAVYGWLRGEYLRQVGAFALTATDRFYTSIAEGNGCADARCFAEKFHVGHGRWFVRSLYDKVREIVLVRDPRDTFCSILAFNAKRGNIGFGRQEVSTDDAFVENVRLDFSRLLAVVDADPATTHLVRYEDLILRPVDTLRELLEFAELDADDAVVEGAIQAASGDTRELAEHRTVGDAGASVARWRRDLPPELAKRCNERFEPILARLGYDLA